MKKILTFIITTLGISSVHAKSLENKNSEELQKDKLETALRILIDEGVIVKTEHNEIILNDGLLNQLRAEGRVKADTSEISYICNDVPNN